MSRPVRHGLAFTVLALLAALPAPAQGQPASPPVQVSLPLQGYHRPGKFMPVRVVTSLPSEPTAPFTLEADGAVTTTARPLPQADDTVPFLPVRPLRAIRWGIAGVADGSFSSETLRPLSDAEVLVGFAPGAASAEEAARLAAEVFPGKTAIPLALDAAEPVRLPTMCWGTLDAVVLASAPQDFRISRHVAAGTAVIVRSTLRPDSDPARDPWPWRRDRGTGQWRVLHFPVAGPPGLVTPDAYELAHGWNPGRPPALRRNVLLLGVLFSVLTLGLALALTMWRSRWRWAAVPAWCAVATWAVARWHAQHPAVAQATGTVFVTRSPGIVQSDVWFYTRALSAQDGWAPWEGELTAPVFASPAHAERVKVSLYCGRAGAPSHFNWPAAAGSVMAFRGRAVYPAQWVPLETAQPPPPDAPPSPLRDLARRAYVGPDSRIAADVIDPRPDVFVPPGGEWWPAVVVNVGMTND